MKLQAILSLTAILNLATQTAQAAADVTFVGNPTVSPAGYHAGNPLTVTYTVKNIGDQTAVASQSRVQIYTPVATQYATADFDVAALAPQEQRTVTHTITNINTKAWSGTWQAGVRLDTGFVIPGEFSGNNASERASFKLIATQWDLKFENDAKPGPCPAINAYGGKVNFAFIIHNDSAQASPATKTRVQVYDRGHNSVLNEQVNTPIIPPHGKIPFVYAYPLPATGTVGGWSAFINLNDQGIFTEATGFNNGSDEVTFQVNAPGSPVQSCAFAPGLMNPRVSGNDIVFDLWGNAGSTLNIQSSTDLNIWAPVTSQSVGNGVNTFSTPRSGPKRYYRAK